MGTKIDAARMATSGGVETVIAKGTRPDVLKAAVAGEEVGTRFAPRSLGLSDYKLWVLFGKPVRGRVVVDAGAVKALRGSGSLLPVGVVGVDGEFGSGDAVMVVDEVGTELAKGIVSCSKEDLERTKGLNSVQVADLLPRSPQEAIHRDCMVLRSLKDQEES